MRLPGTLAAGGSAQILAQVMGAWALVAHLNAWPDISVWVIAPLVAAIFVPFRHDGSLRDRAVSNFGAATVIAGLMWWEVLVGGLDGILGGTGPSLGPLAMLLLAATVLFALAGAMFWLRRERPAR